MILTAEFLQIQNACAEGIEFAQNQNLFGKEYSEVIRECIKNNQNDFAGWMIEQKQTESFVRYTGKEFTMGAYQVFNPLTGLHTRYETEAEATAALIETAKAVLAQHLPTVCQELSNENGDTCWTSVDFSTKYKVVEN